MDIKGTEYTLVSERVAIFRKKYPDGDIRTEIVKLENDLVIIKADIYTLIEGEQVHLSSGTAYEKEGNSFINKTSYIENCETSAVGRALGFLGIGIKNGIRSYEEMKNADLQQENLKPVTEMQVKTLVELLNKYNNANEYLKEILTKYKIKDLKELTNQNYGEILVKIKKELESK